MHGNAVLAEELNKLLSEELQKFLSENEIEVLGSPLPKETEKTQTIDIKQPNDYEFVYELGLAPQFKIGFINSSTTMIKYKIEVTDEMVEEEVERIRKQVGTVEMVDTIEEGDVITFNLDELDESGILKEELNGLF